MSLTKKILKDIQFIRNFENNWLFVSKIATFSLNLSKNRIFFVRFRLSFLNVYRFNYLHASLFNVIAQFL